jgi:putative transposase
VIHAVMMRQGDNPGIERMCALAGVSRAGYYRHWLASKPRQEETALRDEIQRLSLARRKNGYRNGYRPITIQLQRAGWAVNHKRVARIRREDNLLCVPKLSFRPPTTDSRHGWPVWPNLARHLVPMTVNQLWVADITYIRMSEAFVYLAVVLDAFSRRVVGWAMAEHLRAELALSALTMAIGDRDVTRGELVHHSDQGVQYACGDYIARLERAGIQPSMSRAGCPWDNAMAESFMRTLKREEVNGQAYRDRAEARSRRSSRRSTTGSGCIRRWLILRRMNSRRANLAWWASCRCRSRSKRNRRACQQIFLYERLVLRKGTAVPMIF